MSLLLEFYGFREHPFGVSPNPRYLYPSAQHREALASLIFGIDNKVGFAALIAEPGTGKTTILFDVLRRYRELASTAFVFNTQCSGGELLRHILTELQVSGGESERDPVRQHQLFTAYVADRQRTKPVVIIIDEAQHLDHTAMEALRLLSNFEAPDHKLLHIILAGQPQLAEKLRLEAYTQLLQRIMIISRLGRFSADETEECIVFRLHVAGYAGAPLFSDAAMAKIFQGSGGVPREINRICLNSLYLGFALRQKQIGVEVIEEVLSDLDLYHAPKPVVSVMLPKTEPTRDGNSTGRETDRAPVAQHIVDGGLRELASTPTHGALQVAIAREDSSTPQVGCGLSTLAAPQVSGTSAVLKAFCAPTQSRVLDGPRRARNTQIHEELVPPTISDVPVVRRIVDEWESHTPIDPSLGLFRPEQPASAAPIKQTEAAPPPPRKREKTRMPVGIRAVIVALLCVAGVIAWALFGLGSAYVQWK